MMTESNDNKESLQWKCGNCGYTLDAPIPPDTCPSCEKDCEFLNVTCYTPECGGPDTGTTDGRLG